jgi:acyl-CoA synthetase (AMP-forming)/AMP-acid ligase II/acyl carrier protein
MSDPVTYLPPEQHAIREKCFHPSGTFVEFAKEDVEQSIPARFDKIVRMYPHRLAAKTTDDTLTYYELDRRANLLAREIVARRGFRNEPVAIFFELGAPLIIAILGILKAGKIFVVIDPTFPEERINYLLEDSQVSLVIASKRSVLPAQFSLRAGIQLINIDELPSDSTSEPVGLSPSPLALAVLVYTSGSTGRPKGIMQNHGNILHTILRDTSAVHISPFDRVALLRSSSTSGAVMDLFDGLLNGSADYPYSLLKAGFARLRHWLIEQQITILNSVSSIFRHFVGTLGEECFPHLRLNYIGGEPVFKKDADLYRQYFTANCILVVRMGCGEAGKVCQYMIDSKTFFSGNEVPVGYPHEDLKTLLFGDTGEEVGSGGGEIAVESRCGDLGRIMADGSLFHLGRKDSQVKIGGFQVEVVEIEQVLLQHDGVREALVACRADQSGEPCLVAYWVPRKFPGPTVSELRRWLRKELPNYMIPRAFVVLETMPVTPSGKLDRRALPVPDYARPELDTLYVAPRNPLEQTLAIIWADILEIERVGIYDTFFDLGGDSLKAMQVISRAMTTFRVELPIKFLLNSPTVAEMADVIGTNDGRTIGQEELARLLSEIELLSEKEAQRWAVMEKVKG